MYIIYACDNNYARLAGISLFSLLKNNRDIDSIDICILADNVSEANKEKLIKTAQMFNRGLNFFDINEKVSFIKNYINPYANAIPGIGGGGVYCFCTAFYCGLYT